MRVLVTGASGRLGRVIVALLLKKRFDVTALCLSEKEKKLVPIGAQVVYADLTAPLSIPPKIFENCFAVVHAAGLVDYEASEDKLRRVNVTGTRNLLDLCVVCGVKRFVHFSSTSVMGKHLRKMPADESTQCNPEDLYGWSKFYSEQVVNSFAGKLECVILRPPVLYGEGFSEGFFPVLTMLEKKRMLVMGSGGNFIPLLHVEDAALAALLALKRKNAAGETFIITSGEKHTQEELLVLASKELGVANPKLHLPARGIKAAIFLLRFFQKAVGKKPKLQEQFVDVLASNRVFDTSKAKRILGFKPTHLMKNGMKEMVKYYRSVKS